MKICIECGNCVVVISPFLKTEIEYTADIYLCKRDNKNLVTGELIELQCTNERQHWCAELEPLHCGIVGKFFKDKNIP